MLTRDEIGQLFKRWYKPIRQWLSHGDAQLKGGGVSIDDLAQEVFVRLLKYRNAETEEERAPIDNIQGYLFRIAANVRNEWIERSVIRRLHAPELLDDLIEETEYEPQNLRESEDVQEALTRCMEQLTERQCTVLKLHVHEGLTYKQIATRERLTYRVVLRDLTRAYSRLRELMPNMEGGRETPVAPHVQRLREFEQLRLNRGIAEREQKRGRGRPTLRQPELTAEKAISVLEAHAYNISKAAESLGLKNTTLHFRLGSLIPDLDERRVQWKHDRKLRRQAERYQEKRREMLRARQQRRLAEEREELAAAAAQAAAPQAQAQAAAPPPESAPAPSLETTALGIAELIAPNIAAVLAPAIAQMIAPASPAAPATAPDADAMLAALEAHGYNFAAAARALDVKVMTFHYRVRKLVPDIEARREQWATKRRGELLSALEAHGYSYAATAKTLGVNDDSLKHQLRAAFPDLEEHKAKWKEERRQEVKRRKVENESARRRAQTAARQAAEAAEAAARPFPVFCGVAQDVLLSALEATDFNLKDAAAKIGITEPKARHIHLRLIPDFAERRQRAREALGVKRRAEIITALEAHRYHFRRTAEAMNQSAVNFQTYVRAWCPDYPALRAEYLKKHSLGRCGGRLERPEEREARLLAGRENRLRGLREGNARRWNDGGARHALKRMQLQELENQREQMTEAHNKEIADMRKAQQDLHRKYMSMRARQVEERRVLTEKITRTRIGIPGYHETVDLAERRRQREAAGYARKVEVLNSCGGDVHKAAEILGMHHTHVRKWKRENWQPPEDTYDDESENAAAAG